MALPTLGARIGNRRLPPTRTQLWQTLRKIVPGEIGLRLSLFRRSAAMKYKWVAHEEKTHPLDYVCLILVDVRRGRQPHSAIVLQFRDALPQHGLIWKLPSVATKL